MQFSTISTAAFAAMAFLALPTIGAPSPNIEARSAELDARAKEILEARAAALVCQFGGVKACSAECVAKGKFHGGYCNSHETCICNH